MPAFPILPLRITLITALLAAFSGQTHAETLEPPTRIQADEATAREGQFAEARGNVDMNRGVVKVVQAKGS